MTNTEIEVIGQDEQSECTCTDGTVTCTHEGTGRDEDGWCTVCDSPTDQPEWITCRTCQP